VRRVRPAPHPAGAAAADLRGCATPPRNVKSGCVLVTEGPDAQRPPQINGRALPSPLTWVVRRSYGGPIATATAVSRQDHSGPRGPELQAAHPRPQVGLGRNEPHIMAQNNTHRLPGRAQLPTQHAQRAARGLGGAAVLGGVVLGTAFTGGAAQAAPSAPAAPAAPAASAPAAQALPAAPTVTAPSAVLDSTQKLRWGSRGRAVQDLQAALNDQGANLAVDGVFGPRTHSAVKSYQSSNGLLVDGVVGPKTRGALNGAGVSTGGASVSTSSSSSSSSSIVDAARSVVGTPYS